MKKLFRKILIVGIIASLNVAPVVAAEPTDSLTVIQQNFDANYYASVNPDVAAALGTDAATLLNHYLTFGIKEGRQISATFDAPAYVAQHPEVANGTGTTTTAVNITGFDVSSGRALVNNNIYPLGEYVINDDLYVISLDHQMGTGKYDTEPGRNNATNYFENLLQTGGLKEQLDNRVKAAGYEIYEAWMGVPYSEAHNVLFGNPSLFVQTIVNTRDAQGHYVYIYQPSFTYEAFNLDRIVVYMHSYE